MPTSSESLNAQTKRKAKTQSKMLKKSSKREVVSLSSSDSVEHVEESSDYLPERGDHDPGVKETSEKDDDEESKEND